MSDQFSAFRPNGKPRTTSKPAESPDWASRPAIVLPDLSGWPGALLALLSPLRPLACASFWGQALRVARRASIYTAKRLRSAWYESQAKGGA